MRKHTAAEILSFFEQVRGSIESDSPLEAFRAVATLSADLYKHLGRTAEMLMLLHGVDVSDRYLYSAASWVICATHEREVPLLSNEQYQAISDKNAALEDAQSDESANYFALLELKNAELFPKSLVVSQILRRDLTERLGVPEEVVYEGYDIGWWEAARIVVPHIIKQLYL